MNLLKTVVLCLFLFILTACGTKTRETSVVEFDANIAGDASSSVLAVMNRINTDQIHTLRFKTGTYHFYPDKAFEIFRHISNHDDVLTHTPFPIINIQNLTVDGQGSTFIFHGMMIPFLMQNSKDITVKNVSIDWATPFHSEAQVVANNEEKNTYDVHIDAKYPYEIRNGELVFLKEYYEHTMGQSYLFDPETKAAAYNTQAYSTWYTIRQPVAQKYGNPVTYHYGFTNDPKDPRFSAVGSELKSRFEQLSPGIVRVYNHAKNLPPVGMVMVMKGVKGKNRTSPAFHVVETEDFMALDVNVCHAGGMGLIAENSTNLTLDHFNVIPSKGRLVSATADATHFVGCRGRVTIKNCTLSNQLDDGTNIHGAYQEVLEVLDKNRLGVRIGHFQQQGFKLGLPGDTIGLVRAEGSIFPYHQLTLKSLEVSNGRYMILSFNEPLPPEIEAGDWLENLTAYPTVLVQNCNISKNRARGLLISTPRTTVIEKNFFHTEMPAIMVAADRSHWYESGCASHLVIRQNVFQDCSYGGGDTGVIELKGEKGSREITFKDISITQNEFSQFDNLILRINNTAHLSFSHNTIIASDSYAPLYPNNPAFEIYTSEDIEFEKNNYRGHATKMIETDEDDCSLKFQ